MDTKCGLRACLNALYSFIGFLRLFLFLMKPYPHLLFKLFVLYLDQTVIAANKR